MISIHKSLKVNSRQLKLVYFMSKQDDYITMDEIAQKLGCTRRQVEYDIEKLNRILRETQVEEIVGVPKKGILLDKSVYEELSSLLKQGKIKMDYNKEERIAFMIIHIIIGGSTHNYEDFSEKLSVSRTTIFSDMKDIKRIVEEEGGEIFYDYYYNYFIKATGIQYIRLLSRSKEILIQALPENVFDKLMDHEMIEKLKDL